MPIEKIKKTDEYLSKITWNIIFFVSRNIRDILKNMPQEKLTKFLDENSTKISTIIYNFVEKEESSEKIKKFYEQIKKYKQKNSEYWKYFDELNEKEKSIESFKLLIFSILLIPWWWIFVATMFWNPALILYFNWAFLLPKSKLPKPVVETREKWINLFKKGWKKIKNTPKIIKNIPRIIRIRSKKYRNYTKKKK